MLHKYLLPRFAWGAPRRKHHRREGNVRRVARMAAAAAPHPSASLGTHRRTCQLTASAVQFQSPGTTTGFSAGGPRHLRLALCHHPLRGDGWPQAGSASPPSSANADPTCSGGRLGPPQLLAWRSGQRRACLSLGARGRRCPARPPARDRK